MARLLHISGNEFPDLTVDHPTKRIWRELAKGFDEYHILARSTDNRFHRYHEDNIVLHLVPKLGRARSFLVTSAFALPVALKIKPDVLLSQSPLFGGPVGVLLSRLLSVPVMVEIHGLHYFQILDGRGVGSRLMAALIGRSFRRATKIRSLGPAMTQMLSDRGVVANVVEIPTRVDLAVFGPPKQDSKLGHPIRLIGVGSFIGVKAFEAAIDATLALRERHEVSLTLIGGGPLRAAYEDQSRQCGCVALEDRLPQCAVVEHMRSADIYVQPSLSEGMPRAVLEAMAMRLPVVASRVGTVPDLIDDRVNGMLIEPGNADELVEAIESLINDDDLRERIAAQAYAGVCERYEWNSVFDLYRGHLLDMVDAGRG